MSEVTRFTILESFRSTFGVLTANLKPLQTANYDLRVGVTSFEIFSVLDRRSIFTQVLFHKRPTKWRHT